MIVFKPKRRVCEGKEVQFDITNLDPYIWLQEISDTHISFCIDGFIVTAEKKINGIFNKYEYEGDYNIEELTSALIENYSQEIFACTSFAKILDTQYRIFVWPKDYPANYSVEDNLILSIKPLIYDGIIDLSNHKLINIKLLEEGIKKLRGYSFSKVKSLLTANSNVECYLANQTGNPWPGDLDALLYLIKENKIMALIEFKTHNKNSPIENEFIGKYGDQDWRRFEVLYNLQDELCAIQGSKPKLFYIVWGTQDFENHKTIKIDTIEDNIIAFTKIMARPMFGVPSKDLINYIIDAC